MNQQVYVLFQSKNLDLIIFFIFTVLSIFFCPLTSIGQPSVNEFYLNGFTLIKGQDKVYFSYFSNTLQKGIDDSCKIIDGHFSFRGLTSNPAVAFLRLTRDKVMDDQTKIMFIEPTQMEIKLTSDPFEVVMLSGSKTHFEYDSLYKRKKILHEKCKQITKEFENEKSNIPELEIKINLYYEELKKLDYDFFATHPHSFATGYLLQFHYRVLSANSLEKYYYNMNNALKQSIYGIRLKELIPKIKLTLPGKLAPDFTSLSYDNEIITLSKFQGRYVLLDFWADWCVPCRESFPHLIKIYDKYHKKGLEIIGVADNDYKQDAWKKAIENDKVGIWYNVLRGLQKDKTEEIDKTQSINDKFNVHVLPTKILIDKLGMIIGKYEGKLGDEKLEKKLREIFE